MKVLIFGATGMVGRGVLRECLLASDVESVLAVVRGPTGQRDPKLRELVHGDFGDLSSIVDQLTGYDACFFCLGVSSVGMKEPEYRRITYDFTMAAAEPLAAGNPAMTFVYVSGAGTGRGRAMWSRVKGETEDALLALPFHACMFRPALIEPRHGITPKARWARVMYRVLSPSVPLLRRLFPGAVTTTENVGLAMLRVARSGAPAHVIETRDINALAAGA